MIYKPAPTPIFLNIKYTIYPILFNHQGW